MRWTSHQLDYELRTLQIRRSGQIAVKVSYRNAIAAPAMATGSAQAQSPSSETATAAATQPPVHRREHRICQIPGHDGRRGCHGEGQAQEGELTRHGGNSEQG
jgi:hypothetical protein